MWSDDLRSFADTAALIEALDLVVTVDTGCSLGGSDGEADLDLDITSSRLAVVAERTDSPWYPSVRLFRQLKRYKLGKVC